MGRARSTDVRVCKVWAMGIEQAEDGRRAVIGRKPLPSRAADRDTAAGKPLRRELAAKRDSLNTA